MVASLLPTWQGALLVELKIKYTSGRSPCASG
jgi:hypothetical protein